MTRRQRFTFRGVQYSVDLRELALDGEPGRYWYATSGANLASYADRHGHTTKRVCDVVAILSPRVTVSHGARLAAVWCGVHKLVGHGNTGPPITLPGGAA